MREQDGDIRETTAPAVHASPVAGLIARITAPWGERQWLRVYTTASALALLMSLAAAFGTDIFPPLTRMAYWLSVMLAGCVIVQAVTLLMDRLFKLEPLPEAIVQFFLSLPGLTLEVWLITTAYAHRTLTLAGLFGHIAPVAIVTAAMCTLQYILRREPKQSHVFAPEQTAQTPAGAFRERLPFRFRQADIHALSAEDHYLRIYSSAGETLVLMRLYDAIRELEGIEGSQTHRSWWVAKDAVRDVRRSDGRVTLFLPGEVSVPVSRSYAKPLRDSGWF
ncbi:LytTR family DNA-binding domain-containing protein [Asticcacaulis solisilvae]|uniref:LytTR family DNA-binding domain-containing protein n=1 Tax=Asticcacaulis solisilvae TaxID=1217274 RepID=UPI003FD8C481